MRFVDVKNNRIVVLTTEPLETEDLIQASGVDSSVVRAVQSTERPRLLDDVRGGDAYYVNVTSRCSVGFAVTKGPRTVLPVPVTAGRGRDHHRLQPGRPGRVPGVELPGR